jgi:hypothetical protein
MGNMGTLPGGYGGTSMKSLLSIGNSPFISIYLV